LDRQCELLGLPKPEAEYRFHPVRRWRLDWVFRRHSLAVEVDGAVWTGGRHTRGGGVEKDCEKYAEAMLLGWRVLRVTTSMVQDGRAVGYIEKLLNAKG
jgi:very-short-patch-repair endonuclease